MCDYTVRSGKAGSAVEIAYGSRWSATPLSGRHPGQTTYTIQVDARGETHGVITLNDGWWNTVQQGALWSAGVELFGKTDRIRPAA
jgi:hypothetical protein